MISANVVTSSRPRDREVARDRYTQDMHSFRGCYHYESSESLDRALEAAREYLEDDEVGDVDARLFAGFRRQGATLFINASTMPSRACHASAPSTSSIRSSRLARTASRLTSGNKPADFADRDAPRTVRPQTGDSITKNAIEPSTTGLVAECARR